MQIKKGDTIRAVDLYDRQWKDACVLAVRPGIGYSKGIVIADLEFLNGSVVTYPVDDEHVRVLD